MKVMLVIQCDSCVMRLDLQLDFCSKVIVVYAKQQKGHLGNICRRNVTFLEVDLIFFTML